MKDSQVVINHAKMNYRIAIVFAALLLQSCENKINGTDAKRKYSSAKDSLNGNYVEVMSVKGVLTSMKYFDNYKLMEISTFKNGYLEDRMSVDSLGNPTEHFPLLVWTNVDSIANLDTLKFEIRNVNPLTFYQYFYTNTSLKWN